MAAPGAGFPLQLFSPIGHFNSSMRLCVAFQIIVCISKYYLALLSINNNESFISDPEQVGITFFQSYIH